MKKLHRVDVEFALECPAQNPLLVDLRQPARSKDRARFLAALGMTVAGSELRGMQRDDSGWLAG